MHILYLHQYYTSLSGVGNTRSAVFAEFWAKKGHQVTLITSTAHFNPKQRKIKNGNLTIIALPVAYTQKMGYLRRIISFFYFSMWCFWVALKVRKVTVVYASSTPLTVAWVGRWVAFWKRVPFVFEVVDVWPDVPINMRIIKNKLLIKVLNALTNYLYDSAKLIVCLSEGMKKCIVSHGIRPEKVLVNHNGTETDLFKPIDKPTSEVLRVGYTGAVGKANGLEHLLNAAFLLQNKPIQFEIYGFGSELPRIKALSQSMGLNNIVFYPARAKQDLAPIMAQFDVGVVCFANFKILEDNSANKFFDYLASGIPVILNYEGWQKSYLEEYQCGLGVQQGNDKAFAEAILNLAQNPELCNKMGKQARKLALERFDRQNLAQNALNAITNIC